MASVAAKIALRLASSLEPATYVLPCLTCKRHAHAFRLNHCLHSRRWIILTTNKRRVMIEKQMNRTLKFCQFKSKVVDGGIAWTISVAIQQANVTINKKIETWFDDIDIASISASNRKLKSTWLLKKRNNNNNINLNRTYSISRFAEWSTVGDQRAM